MKRKLLDILVMVMGPLLLVSACSDDATNPAKTRGADNDPAYLAARDLAMGFVDSLSSSAVQSYGYDSFDGTRPLDAASDSASIVFDDSTFWWSLYAHSDSVGWSGTFVGSVRFESGDDFQRLPDSLTTTGIDYRATLSFNLNNDSSSLSADFGRNLHLTGLQAEQVVFDGTSAGIVELQIRQSTYNETYSGSMSDVVFNRIDLENEPHPHPVSGALALALSTQAVTPQGMAGISWTIGVTFFADHYSIHFESGDNYWDWDGPYGG